MDMEEYRRRERDGEKLREDHRLQNPHLYEIPGPLPLPHITHASIHRKENSPNGFYITKDGDDFKYKGLILNISKQTDYFRVFNALYSKLPTGGEISYKDLAKELKTSIPKTKTKNVRQIQQFIQQNLTDKNNGFMRYASILPTEDNGKPLIAVIRGYGIIFNNVSR